MMDGNLATWTPQEVLFLSYLTTLSAQRALRILALWGEGGLSFPEFASAVISGIPPGFFLEPLCVPAPPRFVFHNGQFVMQGTPDENVPDPPLDLEPFVERWASPAVPVRPAERTRSLNSFMVFRAFIAPALPNATQMRKSQAISVLWSHDPLKPFWIVLAQAYTTLRDHFELPDPSLATFLENVLTFTGIPSATDYIKCCGWAIIPKPNDNGFNVTRSAFSNVGSLPLTPVSVYEIVSFCRNTLNYATQRHDSTWPLVTIGESSMPMNLRNTIAIGPNTSTSTVPRPLDPLWWILNRNGHNAEDSDREFYVHDLYDQVDASIGNNLIYVSPHDQWNQIDQNQERESFNTDFLQGFPHLDAIRDDQTTS